ncbi:MAG: Cna B-type domain-containing protein [Ruminococcaceae bacterium]|nr:Cna B-type domain-containing protein [Oscillospiraceae bacterium]
MVKENEELSLRFRDISRQRRFKRYLMHALPVFALLVCIGVFWWLKLVGITLAGEAFCGLDEHIHSEECAAQDAPCTVAEHIHDASCYSDISADLETAEDWEMTLQGISPSLSTFEKTVEIAKSQLGYEESTLNFTVDSDGVRRGYTRYGEWYGNPYGDWSVMFASFCLRYAGLSEIPISAGAETMRLEWEDEGLYYEADGYSPVPGDIVFLDKNQNGSADSVAVITEADEVSVKVIEGDLEDRVGENSYSYTDSTILGYGAPTPGNNIVFMDAGVNAAADEEPLAVTVEYSQSILGADNIFVLYTRGSDGNYYAIDGNSNAQPISIDQNGNITSSVSDPALIYWSFEYCGTYENRPTYYISNVSTGKYLHPYADSSTNHGAILTGRWESAVYQTDNGVKFRGARQNAYAVLENNRAFTNTGTLNGASVFMLGKAPGTCTVWLDGTLGGLMNLSDSLNKSYSVKEGTTMKLPEEWQSPSKYSCKLQGWYDVKNNKYYAPGSVITVTESTVFYADWVAQTYDIGVYNSHASDTVSTDDFITTRLFDYGPLFNVQSSKASVSVNASSHSESWSFIESGTVPYKGEESIDFIFRDWDSSSDISYPSGHNDKNTNGGVYSGIYNEELGEILFSTENSFDPETGEGIIGKYYLGSGDHLFQLMTDPSDEHYGYYFYDSSYNAASYNQSEGRFYVYDYLERTSDSGNSTTGKYSDFLPFNSPYANTNGKSIVTYTYDGINGEYAGVNHCQYDAKYNTSGSSQNNVAVNYMFGMSIDMNFYLPDVPGTRDSSGNYTNRDIFGKEMHFKFSGDDDVWVFVDGQLVLDLGGIHGIESGDVNFSTGIVTVNGTQTATLSGIAEGDHVLTIYYLERGSSQSNCALYFNLAPRFSLSIQKEDVLTQHVLNGAQFSVFTDKECTLPATLWESEEAHDRGDQSTNVFTVENGVANMWGFSAGKTYYLRETKPPDEAEYSCVYGIICLSLDKTGIASYSVEIISETDENGNVIETTNGFTVHGFRIDEETQQAFIVVTNAQDWVKETTTVKVMKEWNDDEDHTYDSVTAYLTVTESDGTVRRIREIALSEENDWSYTWTNLPKYERDGVTPVVYGVEEAYKKGYSPTIEKLDKIIIEKTTWAEAYTFKNGGVYILGTAGGYLSTQSASGTGLKWVDKETAENSPLALWTATVSGANVRFVNGAGQILTFVYSSSSSGRYFYATASSSTYQNMVPVDTGNGIRLYVSRSSRNYYIASIGSNGRAQATTTASSALNFVPLTKVTETTVQEVGDATYKITNTPLEEETSLTVTKHWDTGMATGVDYERAQVTVKLFANGKDSGRTVTLSLKNSWTDTFLGLPYTDSDGNVIAYTVEESWETEDWLPSYGPVETVAGDGIPTYKVTVTNTYRWGHGYELPATGGYGTVPWILSGMGLMLISLVSGCILRCKRERRRR